MMRGGRWRSIVLVLMLVFSLATPNLWFADNTLALAPYQASDLLGQLNNDGSPNFTQDFYDGRDISNTGGFNFPAGIQVDTTHHKLYIADFGSNNIQVFNLDSSNNLLDRVPDYVLGSTSFSGSSASTSQNRLYTPFGLAIDTSGQRLFVADKDNHRVVVYDTSSLSNGMNASYVLGQANFTTNTSAVTQTGMSAPSAVAYDTSGQRLFVGDGNRVLVFNVATISNGQAAANVLGQTNFTSSTCPFGSPNVICNASGLSYDSSGQRLFVVDGNHRVLIYYTSSISNGMAPSNVLGQPNFTSSGQATSQSGLWIPTHCTFDSVHNKLYVADDTRVVVYDTSSITDGENAVAILGQVNYATQAQNTTQNGFHYIYGLTVDPTSNRLYVSDDYNYRVMIFDVASITNGENAVDEIGQTDESGSVRWTTNIPKNTYPNSKGLNSPEGMAEDIAHHRLFVSDFGNNRILIYNLDSSNNLLDHNADAVLGQTDLESSSWGTTQSKMSSPTALAYDPSRNWLYVTDDDNSRILVFDTTSITNGENALYVLGQTNFTNSGDGLSATQFSFDSWLTGLAYDDAHRRLFVADSGNDRVLVFDMSNPSNGMAASHVLGQVDFDTSAWVSDDIEAGAYAVTYDPVNNRLYVADYWDDRIMVFDVSTITDGMAASYVLGQPDFETYDHGVTLSFPWALDFDPTTQQLWVTDSNFRAQMFDVTNLANGIGPSAVIGQSDFTSSSHGTTQAFMWNSAGVHIDPTNGRVYIADDMNNRIMVFDTVHVTTTGLPNATKGDAYSQTVATAGSQGALALSVVSGSLPPGLSMNSSGQISGTPASVGTFNFTVKATDDNGGAGVFSRTRSLSITIDAPTAPAPSQSSSPSTNATSQSSTSNSTAPEDTSPQATNTPPSLLNDDTAFVSSSGSIQTLNTGSKVTFTLPNSTDIHTATVNGVYDTYVDLTIASDPINFRLGLNETKNVDVDRNGVSDISVTLLGITNKTAQLQFKQLLHKNQTTTKSVAKTSNAVSTTKAGITTQIIYSVVGVIAAAVLAARLFVRSRKS